MMAAMPVGFKEGAAVFCVCASVGLASGFCGALGRDGFLFALWVSVSLFAAVPAAKARYFVQTVLAGFSVVAGASFLPPTVSVVSVIVCVAAAGGVGAGSALRI